jgi:hypothetical protein
MRYFASHAGQGMLFIAGAVILLAAPLTLPWVAAVVMLQVGVRHLTLAFKELDHDIRSRPDFMAGSPSLPPPSDGERELAGVRNGAIRTRP